MIELYRVINYETGEVYTFFNIAEYSSYSLKQAYSRALSAARRNKHYGYIGIDDARKIHHRKRGVHLYCIVDNMIVCEVPLN